MAHTNPFLRQAELRDLMRLQEEQKRALEGAVAPANRETFFRSYEAQAYTVPQKPTTTPTNPRRRLLLCLKS